MTETPTPAPKLDLLYDFELVVFMVENTLFRVLKQGFTAPGTAFESKFLRNDQLEADAGNAPGQRLDNPIVLTDADEKSFRAFLRVLYPFMWQGPVEAYEDWLGVLRLATLWRFDQIREKAINAVQAHVAFSSPPNAEPKDVIKASLEKLHIGREYRVRQWMLNELCWLLRREGLTPQDIMTPLLKQDWETAARIFYARRMLSRKHTDNQSFLCPYECSCDREIVEKVFEEELHTEPVR